MDAAGNYAVGRTTIDVQANSNNCNESEESGTKIVGRINNRFGASIEQVQVEVWKEGIRFKTMETRENGQFNFTLAKDPAYAIHPKKDIHPLNGVSTFDLILMSKHILGIQKFASPYQYIAADINRSGAITAFDMVQLRQLILNKITDFPNNESWRFVDKAYQFTSENPIIEAFKETIIIDKPQSERINNDFVGIKIGDVNGSAQANNLQPTQARRKKEAFKVSTKERFVEKGATINVEFIGLNMEQIQGYQFTMDFPKLELLELKEGSAKSNNFNLELIQTGQLITSWNGEGIKEGRLFSITFKTLASGWISDLVSLNSTQITAEAYNKTGELLDVNLQFIQAVEGFDLLQNTPNPFNTETIIGFSLPKAGKVEFTVINMQGKLMHTIEKWYPKGANSITINLAKLGIPKGVFYYHLVFEKYTDAQKMVVVE